MTSGDYLRSYKLKQVSVIFVGGQHFTNSYTGIHSHHTYKHIASTFSKILEFRTSARFSGCAIMIGPGQRKKTKTKLSQKKIKISDQGREGFAKILFDYFFNCIFFTVFRQFIHLCKTENL